MNFFLEPATTPSNSSILNINNNIIYLNNETSYHFLKLENNINNYIDIEYITLGNEDIHNSKILFKKNLLLWEIDPKPYLVDSVLSKSCSLSINLNFEDYIVDEIDKNSFMNNCIFCQMDTSINRFPTIKIYFMDQILIFNKWFSSGPNTIWVSRDSNDQAICSIVISPKKANLICRIKLPTECGLDHCNISSSSTIMSPINEIDQLDCNNIKFNFKEGLIIKRPIFIKQSCELDINSLNDSIIIETIYE